MTETLKPARPILPGRILKQELEAHGWTQKDLAAILGRPEQAISEIISGTKQITPETSLALAQAFGTSPELWYNLEANYRLEMARRENSDDTIARRGRLYDVLPLREMARRGWISLHESAGDLEHEVAGLLGAPVGSAPAPAADLCVSTAGEPISYAQLAWLRRAEALAREQTAGEWHPEGLKPLVAELLALTRRAEDTARAPATLARWGVRCVLLRNLRKTDLDGAAFWLDAGPVAALTLRHDRIDAFWFTLLHEAAHLAGGGRAAHLDRLEESAASVVATPGGEAANRMAADWLVPPDAYRRFIAAAGPHFARADIEAFAADQSRHPGIILGRLQRDGLASRQYLRSLLAKVSPYLQDQVRD
jgi:HTH-type transcriptional regulator/antitoxin HigA